MRDELKKIMIDYFNNEISIKKINEIIDNSDLPFKFDNKKFQTFLKTKNIDKFDKLFDSLFDYKEVEMYVYTSLLLGVVSGEFYKKYGFQKALKININNLDISKESIKNKYINDISDILKPYIDKVYSVVFDLHKDVSKKYNKII